MATITHLVFIDIETTALKGPKTREDAIVEIAAARVDLASRKITQRFETLIAPNSWNGGDQCWGPSSATAGEPSWRLGEYHVKAGHFAGTDWSRALKLPQALDILGAGLGLLENGSTIAGQNPRFDLEHLERDYQVLGKDWPDLDYHVIDLASPALFLAMKGIVSSVSLRSLIPWAYAEPGRKQAHRAMGDVQDAIQVFFALHDYFTEGRQPQPRVNHWQ